MTNTSDVTEDPCAPTFDANGGVVAATASQAACANTGITAPNTARRQHHQPGAAMPGQPVRRAAGRLDHAGRRTRPDPVGGRQLHPRFLPGLTASVDYYQIKLASSIGQIPLAASLTNCLNTGNSVFCNLIKRSSNGGLFGTSVSNNGYIVGTNVNVGAGTTSGLDLQAAYRLRSTA